MLNSDDNPQKPTEANILAYAVKSDDGKKTKHTETRNNLFLERKHLKKLIPDKL